MTKPLAAALAACLIAPAAAAQAPSVHLRTTTPDAAPISVIGGATSASVNVFATNDNSPDAAANFMRAWQLNLAIAPDAGATGALTFATPASGTAANPTGYVFGANGLGIVAANSGAGLTANDLNTLAAGTQVPAGPAGANLLTLTFQASTDATGTFGLFATRGAANTAWTDASATPQTRFFVEAPDGVGMARIGTVVVVPVPEPAGVTLILLGGLGVAGACRCHTRRRRQAAAPNPANSPM